ncbi:TPA: nitric oxide reductase transcriptional regulator NorR [Vibrio vulnificus]|uniref:Anaerobic nitric oxide reductase transcription regulator NorR n=1 Tax=Vibrio vulnificus (strain CMCP6) TaxID=216895 RepID=NORR_VIBVU|nr:nitric oxide reductase transcriptional regulator NorR [Vibrio vulnificus]Q8D4F9.1 RecName: Full=Anaerobic nitric oxide reductase transcription regulator NorR [Vibrio vulnificus CMCP6]AAO08229.1 Anaerobic nitric oxide reductase transcription regulator norR [Vibrio vulnificus CMCP6]ASC58726.1 Anaerobic nitric oxide reductase transcription regulator NorR [Vibrio vulnificus]QBN16295.1 nitric oxide reductase transcriptional regulator NorR [Vibrio vulnificus]HAS6187771.1 nitric oxide reductase tr
MTSLIAQWLHITQDLNSALTRQARFDTLLTTIRDVLNCDSSALLLFEDQHFKPLAINGLAKEVLGRRFSIEQHPRLEAIARAGDIVRFPSESTLPDPYDGLITNHQGKLHVHSCIGLPLLIDDQLIGAITIDALDPNQFDQLKNQELRFISALAAGGLHTALLLEQLETQASLPRESYAEKRTLSNEIIGNSQGMRTLQDQIDAVANTELSVLVMGETGVGKELVANAIHHRSDRASNNLVYLNCAALPESVAESELFGHIKGAFTGAISHRKGKFEQADGGTLFLDEVGELSLELQAKLLRALQYGDIQRVGDDRHIRVNTRIVAATNRVLHEEVKAGRFRADLYHRLSVFPLHVPPLREREEDVILLAGFFAEQVRGKLGLHSVRLSPSLVAELREYHWPGNVRELEHVIKRAAVLAKARTPQMDIELISQDFDIKTPTSPMMPTVAASQAQHEIHSDIGLKQATDAFQKKLILRALESNQGNWAATARQLELDSGNLHRLAKRLGIK